MRTAILFTLALLVFSGCEDRDYAFRMNPDGSGRVKYTATFPLDIQTGPGDKKERTDEEKVQMALKKVVTESQGVEAWKKPTCVATDDGLIKFSGIAYFRDLNAVNFASLGRQQGKNNFNLEHKKTEKGYRIVALPKKKKDKKPSTKKRPSTEAEWRKEILRARTSWKYMRHMVGMGMCNNVHVYTFETDAAAKRLEGFKKVPKGYSYTFDGDAVFAAMDELFAKNDAELMAILKKGVDLKDMDVTGAFITKQLGIDPDVGLVLEVEQSKPSFDYEAELAPVKKSFAAFCVKEGIGGSGGKSAGATPETGSKGQIRQVQIRCITRNFPLEENDRARASIELQLTLDGVATLCKKGEAKVVLDQNGESLSEKPIRLSPRLGKGNTSVRFSVRVPLKGNTDAISTIEGEIVYAVGTGSKTVDFGVMEMKKDVKGAAMNASIDSLDRGWLKLSFDAKESDVKSITVLTPDGKPYKATQFHGQIWNGKYQKTMRPEQGDKWPAKLQFKVELYTASETFTAPWSVKNIGLPKAGE